jgi:hypothetical protein
MDLDEVAEAEGREGCEERELAGTDVEDIPGEELTHRVGVDSVGQEGEVAVECVQRGGRRPLSVSP